jgi:flavorubredoxin
MPHLCVYEKGTDKSETYSITNLQDDILYFETFPLIENITDKNEYAFFIEAENLIDNIANMKNDSMKNLVNAMIKESNIKFDSNPVICILKPTNNE